MCLYVKTLLLLIAALSLGSYLIISAVMVTLVASLAFYKPLRVYCE